MSEKIFRKKVCNFYPIFFCVKNFVNFVSEITF